MVENKYSSHSRDRDATLAVVEEVVRSFTYVKVLIPDSKSTSLEVKKNKK